MPQGFSRDIESASSTYVFTVVFVWHIDQSIILKMNKCDILVTLLSRNPFCDFKPLIKFVDLFHLNIKNM